MKRFLLILFVCLFAVNTVMAAAVACTMTQEKLALTMKTDAPCPDHAQQNDKDTPSHSGGMCKCMHACFAKVLYHGGFESVAVWMNTHDQWTVKNEDAVSRSFEPLRRPPRTYS